MKLALDTNCYRDLCDGDWAIAHVLEQANAVFLPFVSLAELRAGFAAGHHGRENERILQRFLTKLGVGLLYATEATTRAYADLYLQLRRQSTPIPIYDLWIAALVVEHNLLLASRDSHFQDLPQIPMI